MQTMLTTSNVPANWKNMNTIQIHKKGDLKDFKNCTQTRLLPMLYRISTKVILNTITDTLDLNQPKEQDGYRKGCSTTNHRHVLNQIGEKKKKAVE